MNLLREAALPAEPAILGQRMTESQSKDPLELLYSVMKVTLTPVQKVKQQENVLFKSAASVFDLILWLRHR